MVVVRAEWVVVLRLSQKQEDGLFTRSDLVLSLCAFAPQLAAVHLVDSHYCTDPGKFISVLCTSLSTMLHVELPHVNVLSKMDLIEQYGKLGKRLLRGRRGAGQPQIQISCLATFIFFGSGKWCKAHWVACSGRGITDTYKLPSEILAVSLQLSTWIITQRSWTSLTWLTI